MIENVDSDRLHNNELEFIDWAEDLAYYAALKRCRINKRKLPNGKYEYVLIDKNYEVFLTIESGHNLMFVPRRRRTQNRKRQT